MFDNLKIHKYIDTPECPRCGSKRTGIYVYSPESFNPVQILEEKRALKKGQLRRTSSVPLSELGYNLFCDDCDASWRGKYKTQYLSNYEIQEKLEEKYIDTDEVDKLYKVDKKLKKENKPSARFKNKYLKANIPLVKEASAVKNAVSSQITKSNVKKQRDAEFEEIEAKYAEEYEDEE